MKPQPKPAMKMPLPADESGMESHPHASFLHSGAYSSFVLTAGPHDQENLLARMEDGELWGSECVQLTEATIFFSVGSDAVNQALWVYLDTSDVTDPPDRELNATFSSRGEQIFLESLIDMTFREDCDQFFLPQGEYEVRFLSWNLEHARDNFDADPTLFLKNVYHELHFISSANSYVPRRTVYGAGSDEQTFG